jgi:flagellar motor switch protein FliN/FliY
MMTEQEKPTEGKPTEGKPAEGKPAEEKNSAEQESPNEQALTASGSLDDRNLELLLDVPISFSAELGGCSLTVKDVLQLTRGRVIELEKLAGDPLDILLNGRLIAKGEAVVVNERFGVRIVDIASPSERLARIKS